VKYIFLAGAPGSKWSSVSNDIRGFERINTTDAGQNYTKPGDANPMHTGAYWDPGMEYGKMFDQISYLSVEAMELEFDQPFQQIDNNPRIIKSHQFCKWLDNIIARPEWIYNPIVIVHRPEEDAERWWHEAGGWDITYPNYEWYRDQMSEEIHKQTAGVADFIANHNLQRMETVDDLAFALGMKNTTNRRYDDMDVYVYVHPRLRYFKDTWRHNTPNFNETGISTVDRIGPDETVLDVGCGDNIFKSHFGDRLVGIDPINPAADFRVSIDEYILQGQFDHALCYGSVNFGSRVDIERQVRKVVQCVKPGGRIHWRMNPGLYDHGRPGQESLDLFPWSSENAYDMARRNSCDVEEFKADHKRFYSLWKKM